MFVVTGSAATAHACRKPKVDALSHCGEQAYPEAFEPCKALCSHPKTVIGSDLI